MRRERSSPRSTRTTSCPSLDALSGDFVADLDQARQALASNAGFNLIYRTTFLRVDIIPCASAFDREAVQRAEVMMLPGTTTPIRVATREDILLAKLRRYWLGAKASETHRRDVERLVALNRGEFDEQYVHEWAAWLGLADLLDRFLAS